MFSDWAGRSISAGEPIPASSRSSRPAFRYPAGVAREARHFTLSLRRHGLRAQGRLRPRRGVRASSAAARTSAWCSRVRTPGSQPRQGLPRWVGERAPLACARDGLRASSARGWSSATGRASRDRAHAPLPGGRRLRDAHARRGIRVHECRGDVLWLARHLFARRPDPGACSTRRPGCWLHRATWRRLSKR